MKRMRVRLTTDYDCCHRLCRNLRAFRNNHKTSTTKYHFVKYMSDYSVCNRQEALRLFDFLVNEKILCKVDVGIVHYWDCKEDLITVDWIRKVIVESNIPSVFGNKGHKKNPQQEQKSLGTQVQKVEVKPEIQIIQKFSTEMLVEELLRRGYNVTLCISTIK